MARRPLIHKFAAGAWKQAILCLQESKRALAELETDKGITLDTALEAIFFSGITNQEIDAIRQEGPCFSIPVPLLPYPAISPLFTQFSVTNVLSAQSPKLTSGLFP